MWLSGETSRFGFIGGKRVTRSAKVRRTLSPLPNLETLLPL
jgi:hypothetical protein